MNFYNDNDLKICAWLRELINQKLIPDGVVDPRSIELIQPDELKPYIQCHFFAGIGGWPEALRLAGWPTDIPVWTGSCPCQPYSCAGNGKGNDDPRNVWPHFRRLIEACHPPVVFGEQVASKSGRKWLSGVFTDLEALGYSRAGADLCAASVGAPHIRQRLYWMADSNLSKRDGQIRIGEQQIHFKSKNTVGLAESESQQHNRSGGAGRRRGEPSNDCELGDSNHTGSQGRLSKELRECSGEQTAVEGGSSGELAHTGHDAGYPELRELRQCNSRNRESGAWDNYELLLCRDGKSRRTQSGVCLLAHGVPARVVRLRGYGNAIVPQCAKKFIEAYLSIKYEEMHQMRRD